MNNRRSFATSLVCLAVCFAAASRAGAAEAVVVRDGKPVGAGICIAKSLGEHSPVRFAAADLREALRRMSGADVPIREIASAAEVPAGPAIVLGAPAAELGAKPQITSLWKDAMRTVIRDRRVLVGGESEGAVNAAVMDLLHEQGVRYLLPSNIPGDIGTIVPARQTVAWGERDHERHPHVRGRRVWGHNVGALDWPHAHASRTWIRRNMGVSPVLIPSVHAWGGLIPEDKRKPEYFAVKRYDAEGNPVRGGQFCVSHPDVPKVVAETIIARFRENPDLLAQSISPNDGGGACVCLRCHALDPEGYLEPSSGAPALSDRYIYFFNKVAEIVSKEFPDRYLAYLVYSDYSRAPIRHTELHPMIVPVFAPIRYPRLHSMFNPLSEQNIRLRNEIEKYARYAKHIGYYGYNYNLAETIVPFSKIGIWSRDLPWLCERGLFQATLETLGNWNTNGPHAYLSARYLYSGEDPAAIMADYYRALGGAAAEPLRAYWQAVDEAYRTCDVHSGSFYGVERVLTPERIAALSEHLDRADELAETEREKAVVAFFRSGLQQGRLTTEMIRHLNAFRFGEAKAARDELRQLNAKLEEQHVVSIYPNRYLRWFMDAVVDDAADILEGGGRMVLRFPDRWHIRLDHYDVGVEEEWFDPAHGSTHWQSCRTWGAPSLYSQGFGDFKGPQWFKVAVDVPPGDAGKLALWFGSNDGRTRLWINGRAVPFALADKDGTARRAWEFPRGWRAFSVPVGRFVRPGEQNVFVLRIDHTLNDLNLGGILRPVLLYEPGAEAWQEMQSLYSKIEEP